MQLSIIIVNYNVQCFLEQCIISVIAACKNIEAEIIVVDNDSTDGSKLFFNNRFKAVQFIWLKRNLGFAKANNIGLAAARGSTILFLNPDTIVPEDCFEQCLTFFHSKDKAGALGIRMIDGSGCFLKESKRGFPSLFTSFCKLSGLTVLFPSSTIFANYYLGHLPENKNQPVAVLSGAFMMVDKKVLDKLGGFDETFFMYAEDIDLSYRIQKAGYLNYYFAESTILHFKGESTKKETLQYINTFYGAMILFVKKHHGLFIGSMYTVVIQAVIAIKSLRAGVNSLFKKSGNKPEKKFTTSKAFVVSDTDTFKLIQQSTGQLFATVEKIDSLKMLTSTGNTIVLSNPHLSFKDIIQQIQQYKGQHKFFIHAAETSCLVGSDDKNNDGTSIIL